jgi:valyl-tRNA synthetase
VLLDVLSQALRLLHPLLPFVTEEIWGKLPVAGCRLPEQFPVAGCRLPEQLPVVGCRLPVGSVCNTNSNADSISNTDIPDTKPETGNQQPITGKTPETGNQKPTTAPLPPTLLTAAPYPAGDGGAVDTQLEADFALVQELIVQVRTLRAECTIPPEKKLRVTVRCAPEQQPLFAENRPLIMMLAGIAELELQTAARTGMSGTDGGQTPAGIILLAGTRFEALVFVADAVDIAFLKGKFNKEAEKDAKYIAGLEAKLANEKFVQNAPPELVAQEREKLTQAKERTDKLRAWLKRLN